MATTDPNPYGITDTKGVYQSMAQIKSRIQTACHFPWNKKANRKAVMAYLLSDENLSGYRGCVISYIASEAAFDDKWFE